VRDGVIYFTTHNATMAVDALTGQQLWKDTSNARQPGGRA